MIEPASPRPHAATAISNLSFYRVTDTEVLAFGQRRIRVGPVELAWAKPRSFCDEYPCLRQTFTQENRQGPPPARSTRRFREALVAAVIGRIRPWTITSTADPSGTTAK
nr:hypothetical protein GCM10017547_22260 [Pseudarthrobacter oxydans]